MSELTSTILIVLDEFNTNPGDLKIQNKIDDILNILLEIKDFSLFLTPILIFLLGLGDDKFELIQSIQEKYNTLKNKVFTHLKYSKDSDMIHKSNEEVVELDFAKAITPLTEIRRVENRNGSIVNFIEIYYEDATGRVFCEKQFPQRKPEDSILSNKVYNNIEKEKCQ